MGEQNEGPVVNAKRLTDPRDGSSHHTLTVPGPHSSMVAIATLQEHEGMHGSPLFGSLLVDSAYRRSGLATVIVAKAEEIAAECSNRIFAVTDPENEASCGLFAKLGYRKMILWEKKVEPRA